jgi:protein SCO1/2
MISRRSGLLLLALLLGAQRMAVAQTVLERPFTLVDTTGRTISDKDLRGRWLLVFFGYTSCPDICPTTLGSIAAVLERLGSAATHVQPVFITVDPTRDTPAALGAYLASFDQRIIGLTGNDEQIARTVAIFGAQYFKVPGSDPKEYAIAHSALIYLIGPEGGIVTQFSNANDPEELARTLTSLIE